MILDIRIVGLTYRMISDFQRLYATLGENNPSFGAKDPRSGVLCELDKISKTKYLRLNIKIQ